jgi:uncharacterized protein (DUF342 family)
MISVAERFGEAKEQPAISDEAREAERLEAQRVADAQALAAWTAYKDAELVKAKSKADELTASTSTLVTTCTNMAKSKANWIRSEVAASKQRINDSIARLAETVDPSERERIEAEIESEKNTIDGWVVARPVDAKRVAEVIARDRKNAGVE